MSGMSPEAKKVRYLLNAVISAKPEEINCDEAQELFDYYVELEMAGKQFPEELNTLRQHLEWCGCCKQVVAAIKAAMTGTNAKD